MHQAWVYFLLTTVVILLVVVGFVFFIMKTNQSIETINLTLIVLTAVFTILAFVIKKYRKLK